MNKPVESPTVSHTHTVESVRSPWLHRFSVATSVATGLLIVAGGLVTSHDAGLAVPDWPTSYGHNMFTFPYSQWVGGIFYEHGHRLIASTVGMMTILLSLWLWRAEKRLWMKVLGAVALLAVVVQGILGGMRVTQLARVLAIPHACLAQAFFCLTVAIALFTSRGWDRLEQQAETTTGPSLRSIALLTTLAVYMQLILGAMVRHSWSHTGLVIGPALIGHLAGALAVMACVGWVGLRIFAQHAGLRPLTVPCGVLVALFMAQIGLGLGALVARVASDVHWPTRPEIVFTTAHVATGALLLAASVVVTLRTFRLLAPATSTVAPVRAAERVTS